MARKLQGTIVSDKADKTVVVRVAADKEHPVYRKKYAFTQKYQAHDETNQYKVGDLVEISETRPLSKTKRWVVDRKIEASEVQS